MANTISSRTPDGVPNHCPICSTNICVEPSLPQGDAPCPNCGTLLWFFETSADIRFHESKTVGPLRDKLIQLIYRNRNLRVNEQRLTPSTTFLEDVGMDSLDLVELVMELEETFRVPIPEEDQEKIKTVGDAIDYLARRRS